MEISFIYNWWYTPIIFVVVGYFLSDWYYKKNKQDGNYMPDFVTPYVALIIFVVFIIGAIGYTLGKLL